MLVDAGAGQLSPAGVIQAEHLRRGPEWADPAALPTINANVAANLAAGLQPWKPEMLRDATVAIVGYGPSLKYTLDELRVLADAGVPVWTCSKAHDAVRKAGIKVSRHTDLDYRPHKAAYIDSFDPDVEYVMGLQIAPAYLQRLRENGVEPRAFLARVPGVAAVPPAYRLAVDRLPDRLQWVPDVGLQIAALAYGRGYRNQHWFGMDAGLGKDGETHAGYHGGITSPQRAVRVGPVEWQSTEILLREAVVAEEMLRAAPKLRATIHGDGFLRAFLRARGKVSFS